MSWLNIVKGDYPSLSMVTLDRTVDKTAGAPIVRGSVMVDDGGSFRLTEAGQTKGGIVYWSLNGETEPEAEYAGSNTHPKIAGLPCTSALEIETDQFVAGTYAVGEMLTPDIPTGTDLPTGKVKGIGADPDEWVVGIVTAVPSKLWINDAVAIDGKRLGNQVDVIRFSTVYIPVFDAS